MHRVATIRVYESWGEVIAECRVVDFHMSAETPGRTSRCHVQVHGTGDEHPTHWMAEALRTLCRTYPEPDDGE